MLAWSQAMAAAAGKGVAMLVQQPSWRSKHSSDSDHVGDAHGYCAAQHCQELQ
jgi:hypothetical protein